MATDQSTKSATEDAPPRTWPVIIKLAHPVEFGRDTVETLTLRRGKLGDIRGMKVDGVPAANDLMLLASRMSGQPLKVIESLDPDDAGEVIEVVMFFFASCLTAGKKP